MSSTGKEVSLNKTQVSGIVFWDVSGIGDRCSNSYGALSAIAGSLVHTLRLCWGPTSFSLTKCQTATLPQRPNTTNKLGLMFGKSTVQHRPRTSHRTAQAVLQGKGAAPHNRNKSQSKVWATPTKKKFAELTVCGTDWATQDGGGFPKRQIGLEAMGQATPGARWHWSAHPHAWWRRPAPSVRCKGCLSTWWASQGWKGEK